MSENITGGLDKSVALSRHIFEATPVPYLLVNETQNRIYLNPAFTRTFGYAQNDIASLADWWSLAYPEVSTRQQVTASWHKRIERLPEANQPFEPVELSIHCKDGRTRIVMASATRLKEKSDSMLLIMLYDVTALKASERLREASESKYRLIVETAQEGIWTIDASNNTTFVNAKMAEIFGYRIEEMLGRSMYDFMDEEGRDIAKKNIERRKAGIAEQHDFKFINKQGNAVWTELQTSPLYDDDGNYIGALAMVTDITERYLADAALRDSERKYRNLFENMTTGFALHEIICDEDGNPVNYRYLEANPAFERLTGVSPSVLIGKTILDIMPNTEKYWIEVFGRVALTGEPIAYQNYSRELGRIYDTWVFSPAKNQFAVIFTDVTERKQAEDEIAVLAERLNLATEAAELGIWDWDIKNDSMSWDDRIFFLYGIDRNEYSSSYANWIARLHPDDKYMAEQSVQAALQNDVRFETEFRIILPDGTLRHIKADGQVIRDAEGNPLRMLGVNYDITERIRSQEKLHFMAHHDALTTLPNRMLFMDRLELALTRARRYSDIIAVFYLDLDRFKNINDSYGHETGDKFLKQIAVTLNHLLRGSDTIARLGGDEFALIVENIHSVDEVMMVADKILEELSHPYLVDNREFYVTTSIGISLFPNDADDANSLLRNADIAMYRAKELGRNNYQFYSEDLSVKAMERLTLENDLRRAIEKNEFILNYQPQIDLRTGRVIAVEALIRWQHPHIGIVPPSTFISLAEETGLIIPIGQWVLDTVCKQLASWMAEGLAVVPVTVNISTRQLNDNSITGYINQLLATRKLPAKLLEIEITEGVMMHNPQNALEVLRVISELGIGIAIDDFGTGYSSLAYLKRYPINTLKIDKSFVRDLHIDPNDASIVRAIIVMAHSIGMRVIAEGVETVEQLNFLKQHDCDGVQGFYYAHPMACDLMHDYLLKKSKSD